MSNVTTPPITDATGVRLAVALEHMSYRAYNREESDNRYSRKSTWVSYTISASGWNSSTKEYSIESTYPSASYDIIEISPNENTTDAMREAWAKADCGGYYATNKFKAHGDVPTIDIVVSLCVVNKS